MTKVQKVQVAVALSFAALMFNLFRMQILMGGYYNLLSEKNRLRVVYLEGPRGSILDRNGEVLADNRLSFNCSSIPQEARRTIHDSCERLSQILNIDTEVLEKRFKRKKAGAFNTVLLAEDISREQAISIEEQLDSLPGILIETRPQRQYPAKDSTAHLLGFIGPLSEKEVDELEVYGYKPADWIGEDGVEKYYESYLRGRSGGLQIEVDNRGRLVKALAVKEPTEGKDIQLTVDIHLQEFVQKVLDKRRGAVIVMELAEGGLLSMNSSPTFDANLFSSINGRKKIANYFVDEKSPLMNRGVQGIYPPGSIFKMVTAMAALESGKVTAFSTFECAGHLLVGRIRFGCWYKSGHGPQNLAEALAHSCNVYFYRSGLAAGIDALAKKARAFGLDRLSGIDVPGEKKGVVPSEEWKRKNYHQAWYSGETANTAIGQGYLQISPVGALVMVAAVATNGQIFKPHVIDKIEEIKVASKHIPSTIDGSDENWKAVRAGLYAVIHSETGTGRLVKIDGLNIAGKTGTAQSGQDHTHAWFVGFAPAENPKIAMVVFLEQGGRGGVEAAQAANAIFKWLQRASYL